MRELRLALPPLALLLAAAAPLELPAPIALPQPADPARVDAAVREALAQRHWDVRADAGAALTAERSLSGRALRIRIERRAERLELRYVDSERLGHEAHKGEHFIDPAANDWLRELDEALRAQLQRAWLEHEPVRVVPAAPPRDEPAAPPVP